MSTLTQKKFVLRSSDGETFEVGEVVALQSQTIKHLIELDCANTTIIPILKVSGKILSKVIDYCVVHAENSGPSFDYLKTWDSLFVDVDKDVLFDLIKAANYLNIKSLLDLTCQTAADMIKGKTPKEICNFFNVKNNFTPEEEGEICSEKALVHFEEPTEESIEFKNNLKKLKKAWSDKMLELEKTFEELSEEESEALWLECDELYKELEKERIREKEWFSKSYPQVESWH